MRSIVCVFALATSIAAPLSAVAAAPNTFTTPTNARHQSQAKVVEVTLMNYTSHASQVKIGDQVFKVNYASLRRVIVPVGSPVTEYSNTNTKANNVQLGTVADSDRDNVIRLK